MENIVCMWSVTITDENLTVEQCKRHFKGYEIPDVWLTAIIFCCDSVIRETDRLLTNCYRLELTLPLHSKELEELDILKKIIKNNRPQMTAAGFFEIKRSTLLALLSTTTTYFIVALQFNSL
ncbi:gustatory receptor 68a-like [Anoplophora glabripennis]|uniref:gustatory receptor 68a-like n=1 Tax=Anoplophora glabripennis TaxID=217634 RepID=UPI000C7846A2|nr:gustatory receptor 68a-like [Anoplophora glabripennis]